MLYRGHINRSQSGLLVFSKPSCFPRSLNLIDQNSPTWFVSDGLHTLGTFFESQRHF